MNMEEAPKSDMLLLVLRIIGFDVSSMFMLTDFERLALLCGCTALLGIVIILTTCLVCPCCWLNKKLNKRQRIKDENKQYYVRNSFELSFMDAEEPPPPYEMTRRLSPIGLKSSVEFPRRLTSVNSVSSSVCSDTDSLTGIPLPSTADTKIPESETTHDPSNPGNVALTLQFKQITCDNGKTFPQLRIDLKEASDLPTRSYGGRCNPYFVISLYDIKVFKKKKHGKVDALPVFEFHSTEIRKSLNPVYNESFFIPMENRKMKKCVLMIEAWDKDKLANDTILGEAHYYLKDVATVLLKEPSKELDICLKLEEAKYNYGHLLLGLCYLPTAERMTVAVLKASNLMRLKETDEGVDFYVQAMAIYAGKISEKRKTSRQPASQLPVFNEMLMFDVPFSKLDDMVLLLAVHCTVESTVDEGENSRIKRNDSCIGKVVIGASSRKTSSNHWNAIRSSPRRQIVQWHELR